MGESEPHFRASCVFIMKLFSSMILAASASEFGDIIETVNKANANWVAGENFHPDTKIADLKMRMGAWNNKDYDNDRPYPNYELFKDVEVPDTFDARTNWPSCSVIGKVRDQGGCGSCWAFGAAESISDRICIASQGKVNVMYAAEDILSCCMSCGDGCDGGFPLAAMDYYASQGVVTGGLYGESDTCQPYTLKPCEHHVPGNRPPCTEGGSTPKCEHKCIDSYNKNSWQNDKDYGEMGYSIPASEMQKEIMTLGPIEAAFDVYADFLAYKTGVYKHVTGDLLGGHAIKIMGWGTENGEDYWLVMNSWNSDWGDHGTFKILRGSDECGIEDGACAAKVKKTGSGAGKPFF